MTKQRYNVNFVTCRLQMPCILNTTARDYCSSLNMKKTLQPQQRKRRSKFCSLILVMVMRLFATGKLRSVGDGEVAPWLNGLLYKCKDPSLNPQKPHINATWASWPACNYSPEQAGQEDCANPWALLRNPVLMNKVQEQCLMHTYTSHCTHVKLENLVNNLTICFSIILIPSCSLLRPVLQYAPGITGALQPREQKASFLDSSKMSSSQVVVHQAQTFTLRGNAFLSTAASSQESVVSHATGRHSSLRQKHPCS